VEKKQKKSHQRKSTNITTTRLINPKMELQILHKSITTNFVG